MKTQNLAIVVTDIAGFTSATARQTREENAQWLASHSALLQPCFAAFGGTVRKEMGDAFLVSFPSPTDAVLCASAILDRLWQHNQQVAPLMRLDVRVVVNMGEVRVDKQGVHGEPVNVAAKVEEVADGGHITLTEAVFLTMNRSEVEMDALGPHRLDGQPEPVNLYRVRQVAAPTADGQLAASYPYGGLQLHRLTVPPPRGPSAAREGMQRMGDAVAGMRGRGTFNRLAVLGALAALVWIPAAMGARALWRHYHDPFRPLVAHLARGDARSAGLVWDTLEEGHQQARWQMDYYLGRISAAEGQCGDVMDAYEDALAAHPDARGDADLIRDAVACLGEQRRRVMTLVQDTLGKSAVPALATLALDTTLSARTRLDALTLLDRLQALDAVDQPAVLVAVVQSQEPCKHRREAVLQLAALKAPSAYQPLKKVLAQSQPDGPLEDSNGCLVGALTEAVRDLE